MFKLRFVVVCFGGGGGYFQHNTSPCGICPNETLKSRSKRVPVGIIKTSPCELSKEFPVE